MAFEISLIMVFLGLGIGFVFISLLFGSIVRPRRLKAIRNETYECGEEPIGSGWYNFNPRFYVFALIFLIFDVEIVVTYPVILVLKHLAERGLGLVAFLEIFFFTAVLAAGLAFLWRKGDLEWNKSIQKPYFEEGK